MNHHLLTVVLGLSASLAWGAGDFSGGLATRRASVLTVVVSSHAVGFLLLVTLALTNADVFPGTIDLIWGTVAGLVGAIGVVAFYQALSIGRMGITAPIAALLAATLPVIVSAFIDGAPALLQIIGFALALVAVLLISRPEKANGRPKGLGLAILAGFGFGGFFILINQIHSTSIYWPLAGARLTSFIFLLIVVLFRKQKLLPKPGVYLLVFLSGILDVAGNSFFVLAIHSGRLDVATILSSLYPAATVLLARLLLKEHMTRPQAIGILIALVAIPLISI